MPNHSICLVSDSEKSKSKIFVPISVTLVDDDGSESYTMEIIDNLVNGTKLFEKKDLNKDDDDDTAYEEIIPSGGFYNISQSAVNALYIQAPLHYSSFVRGQGMNGPLLQVIYK